MTIRPASALIFLITCTLPWVVYGQAEQAPNSAAESGRSASTQAPAAAEEPEEPVVDAQGLYDAAKQLFDEYAPEEIKEEYEFPSHDQWATFATRLQRALEGGSLEELATYEPEVRRALSAFRMLPEYGDYADWLAERLDLIETARIAVENAKSARAPSRPAPKSQESVTPSTPPAVVEAPQPSAKAPPNVAAKRAPAVPYYNVWFKRLQKRPAPQRADELVPLLKVIFDAEGLPAELAWLAEVESSLNPTARSPKGARGLFQLMPATAKSLGLSLMPFDERVNPGKSARAAAQMLRRLHGRFDSWPLALAAYNAGETRVAATLKKHNAKTFADIAEALPAETRMYVPKVFATVAVREQRENVDLPPPRPRGDSHAANTR